MALQIETIRATADRVAASHLLDIVDLELTGGAKHRTLRVFLEKNEAERTRLAAADAMAAASAMAVAEDDADSEHPVAGQDADDPDAEPSNLPKGVPVERLSFVTHEDCATFATDFGTVLDVEDLIPGAEYTLEVSSPGLERKLLKGPDYTRFLGSLAKIQTFTAIESNRHFTGRLTAFADNTLTLDVSAVKQKGRNKKAPESHLVEIHLSNIEKANLVAEI